MKILINSKINLFLFLILLILLSSCRTAYKPDTRFSNVE